MHVVHNIYKFRLDRKGDRIGKPIREGLRDTCMSTGELKQTMLYEHEERKQAHATAKLRCGSCYQSHLDEDDCCQTCVETEKAFQEKGWELPKDYIFEQCEDRVYRDNPPQDDEGCYLQVALHVRKVNAQILMGVGKFFKHDFVTKNSIQQMSNGLLDFKHTIQDLTFGPDFPGFIHVLDDRVKDNHVGDGTEHYQYDVHVIPTRYTYPSGKEVVSHQYSVTEYMKPIHAKARQVELVAAGLFLNYDFTPFEVKVVNSRKKLSHFLTECCAILGGIFAFSGMLDAMAYRASKAMARRLKSSGDEKQIPMN